MKINIILIALIFSLFGCVSCDKNETGSNYTKGCFDYIDTLAKAERWEEAVLANCLCQQVGKASDQNLCKGAMRNNAARFVRDQCLNISKDKESYRECKSHFSKDWL